MRFLKYVFVVLFISVSQFVAAQQKNTYTLQDCLAIAVKNNLQVKQSSLNAESNHLAYLQAKENLLPAVSGSAGRTLSQGRAINSVTNTYVNQSLTSDNYGLNGSLTLFNGLALQNAIKQASLAYEAGKMDFQAAKDIVTLNLISNYLSILNNLEIIEQVKSQLEVSKQTVARAEIYEKEGANKAASDIYDFKGQQASNEVAVVTAQNSLNAAKLSLFQIMNMPYNPDATFEPIPADAILPQQMNTSTEQIYQNALNELPAVKAARLRTESYEKALKVSKGYLYPNLNISGGLSTTYSSAGQKSVFTDSTTSAVPGMYVNSVGGKQAVFSTQANYATQNISYADQFKNNYGTYLALNLNIPIFSNFTKRNAISQAKINLQIYQNLEDNVKVQLRQNIEQAYYNMSSAYNRYQAIQGQVNVYSESFRINKLRYEAGVITSVDYIIAKNNLDNAKLNLISAKYDYYTSNKLLDYYQGKLSF